MNIYLNGSVYELSSKTSISTLLVELDLVQQRVAIEVNGEIVPRSLHAEIFLFPLDRVEVIHAIGGG